MPPRCGPGLVADVTLDVPKGLSASAAHQVGEHAKTALRREASSMDLSVSELTLHLDPSDRQEATTTAKGATRLGPLPQTLETSIRKAALRAHRAVKSVAHCILSYDGDAITAKVDVVLPDALTLHEAHVVAYAVRRAVLRNVPDISDVDVDCELKESPRFGQRRGIWNPTPTPRRRRRPGAPRRRLRRPW